MARSFRPAALLREGLTSFFRGASYAGCHEDLFALSDAQLSVRGYCRDGLTRSFMSARSYG